jgi:alpha-galactosidase
MIFFPSFKSSSKRLAFFTSVLFTLNVHVQSHPTSNNFPMRDITTAAITEVVEQDSIPPLDKTLALKPPMGWNSWDCFGLAVTEDEVKANADFMAKNLKQLGYEYVVVDMLWYGDEKASDFEDFVHERMSVKPGYTIDEFGRPQPDTTKFPSAKGGKGFKPLADYVHSLGLKLGLHILRGMPWNAGDNNLKILGTTYTTKSIAQPDNGCVWWDGFYGIDMKKPGAQEYYNSLFKQYAEWNVDFIKADDIVNIPEMEGISKALRTADRKMVLSLVPDNDIIPGNIVGRYCHMGRTGFDFWDDWQMLKVGFPVAAAAVKNESPGYWPDLDMLPVGKIGIKISYKGPKERIAKFTKDELQTLFSLWYITRMPLMIGGHLPQSDTQTLSMLTNREALEVNRNSSNNRQVKFKNAVVIWAADIPDSQDKYIAFFNPWDSEEPVNIKIDWKQLGLPGDTYKVRNLWTKKDLGEFRNGFQTPVNAHGAVLCRVSK